MSAVMGSNFVVTLLLAGSMNQLWSMINGLQLAVHMPLFNCAFPSNANFFITFLIDVATFDFMPGEATEFVFQFPDGDPYSMAFEMTKYDSMYAIQNLGSCFLFMTIYFLQVVFWIFASCF